jgi:hypothetical protein
VEVEEAAFLCVVAAPDFGAVFAVAFADCAGLDKSCDLAHDAAPHISQSAQPAANTAAPGRIGQENRNAWKFTSPKRIPHRPRKPAQKISPAKASTLIIGDR